MLWDVTGALWGLMERYGSVADRYWTMWSVTECHRTLQSVTEAIQKHYWVDPEIDRVEQNDRSAEICARLNDQLDFRQTFRLDSTRLNSCQL